MEDVKWKKMKDGRFRRERRWRMEECRVEEDEGWKM